MNSRISRGVWGGWALLMSVGSFSQCRFTPLAGPDADGVEHGDDEDLSVADAARGRDVADRLHDLLGQPRFDHDLDLDLGHEVDDVGRAAMHLALATGAAEATHFGDRHAADAELGEAFLDLV